MGDPDDFEEHDIVVRIRSGFGYLKVDVNGRNVVYNQISMTPETKPEHFNFENVLQQGLSDALSHLTFKSTKGDIPKLTWLLGHVLPRIKPGSLYWLRRGTKNTKPALKAVKPSSHLKVVEPDDDND